MAWFRYPKVLLKEPGARLCPETYVVKKSAWCNSPEYTGNPTRVFEQFMGQIMGGLEDKSLLLLFDEYELMETKMDDGVLRSDLVTFFGSLLEAHPRLSFIFTGSRNLAGCSARRVK